MRLPNISLPGLVVSGVLLWIFVKPLMDYLDLGGSGYLGTILWIPIGVSIAVLGIIVYGIYSSKSTKGPELVAQIAGVLLIFHSSDLDGVVGWDRFLATLQTCAIKQMHSSQGMQVLLHRHQHH